MMYILKNECNLFNLRARFVTVMVIVGAKLKFMFPESIIVVSLYTTSSVVSTGQDKWNHLNILSQREKLEDVCQTGSIVTI